LIDKEKAAPGGSGQLQKTSDDGSLSTPNIATSTTANAVIITIGGEPVAKGRPRFVRKTGIAFTPSHVRKYEAYGKFVAQQVMDGKPPITVPVSADIIIDLPVPASWSAKRRDAALRGDIRPTTRPDADNYVKAALDAVNAIVIADDSLVVDLVVTKQYATVPQLTITVTPLPAATAQGKQQSFAA
jgi:Holliday junction resolvase RusA-like endonuclease